LRSIPHPSHSGLAPWELVSARTGAFIPTAWLRHVAQTWLAVDPMESGRSGMRPDRMLIEFQGPVRCQANSGAVSLVLRGVWRGEPTEVLFGGADLNAVAAVLNEVRVTELDAVPAGRCFRIDNAQTALEFCARSVQVHREVGIKLFAAVPPPRVAVGIRAAWLVLLSALRLPGLGRLLLGSGSSQ
jgi:hypothetical protein